MASVKMGAAGIAGRPGRPVGPLPAAPVAVAAAARGGRPSFRFTTSCCIWPKTLLAMGFGALRAVGARLEESAALRVVWRQRLR